MHFTPAVGCLLLALGRRLLKLALLHYVDDFFGGGCSAPKVLAKNRNCRNMQGDRKESIASAEQCFARLVRACLGETAVSQRKLEHGNDIVVLGIRMQLDETGVSFSPDEDKVEKWSDAIQRALLTQVSVSLYRSNAYLLHVCFCNSLSHLAMHPNSLVDCNGAANLPSEASAAP